MNNLINANYNKANIEETNITLFCRNKVITTHTTLKLHSHVYYIYIKIYKFNNRIAIKFDRMENRHNNRASLKICIDVFFSFSNYRF